MAEELKAPITALKEVSGPSPLGAQTAKVSQTSPASETPRRVVQAGASASAVGGLAQHGRPSAVRRRT